MDFHFKPAELALWSSACVIFGWLIKSHFSSGRDLRKQNFRSAILGIRDQFNLVRDELLVDAHAQSLPRIREECSKIRDDLGGRRWDALNSLVTTYSGLRKNEIENRDTSAKARADSNQPAPANYALGRARLTELLNDLLKFSE